MEQNYDSLGEELKVTYASIDESTKRANEAIEASQKSLDFAFSRNSEYSRNTISERIGTANLAIATSARNLDALLNGKPIKVTPLTAKNDYSESATPKKYFYTGLGNSLRSSFSKLASYIHKKDA